MADTDKVFSGAIPDIYDTYLVPMIFEEFAHDLAVQACSFRPNSVLETATGSGVVTRALAPMLGANSTYMASDLNQPMLDRAIKQQANADTINWCQADALNLPFQDDEFDVVLCQFGVMFFPDKAAGYREALRVLKPQGHFLFNVWTSIENNEFADIVTQAAGAIFPDDPPRFLARTPHGYHDISQIQSELREAGFSKIEAHTITLQSPAQSPRDPAIAYCQGTPLRTEIEARDAAALSKVTDAAAAEIKSRCGSGPISGKIQAHVFVAHV